MPVARIRIGLNRETRMFWRVSPGGCCGVKGMAGFFPWGKIKVCIQ